MSGTIGSIGAGPSVAMAKLSVKGKGGMGLEVVRDQDGIFEFTRRFESGVATDLKIPSANTVVGEVNVGGKADIVAKQIAGQTIRFDDLSKPNEVQMARAGFLLETMSLAGVTMSPIAGLLIAAIVSTLNDLAGVSTVMDRYQTELYTGTGLEGSVGVDFSVYLGKKSLIGFNFLEAMQRVALNDRYVTGLRAPASYRYEFHTAHDFDLDLFKFSIKPLDKSEIESDNLSLLSLGVGSEASYECTFDANRQPLTYRLTLAGGGDVDIFGSPDFSRYSSAELVIPTDLLSKITAKGGGVAKITRAFDESEKIALPVGPNALLAECQNLYGSACDLTEIGQLPAYLQFHDIKGMGEKVGLEISLDAALGAGLGFSLGIESNYFEERDVVSQKSVLLPPAHAFMVESNAMDIPANELMTLKSLLTDWLSGAALLVKSAMLNLWSKFEQAIEAARSFTVTVVDAGQKVAAKAVGLLSRAGRFVIIRLSPASNRILYKAFEEPVVKNVYFSNRVSTGLANQTPAVLTEDATVYMVSDNYALNFYPNSGGTVAYFNGAVDFSISVENEFMDRLGFTTSDKSKVRMFYYHDSTHTWIRLDSDFNASADTVACRVLRAGSYALGIEVSPSDDKQAPDIRELYPPEGRQSRPMRF